MHVEHATSPFCIPPALGPIYLRGFSGVAGQHLPHSRLGPVFVLKESVFSMKSAKPATFDGFLGVDSPCFSFFSNTSITSHFPKLFGGFLERSYPYRIPCSETSLHLCRRPCPPLALQFWPACRSPHVFLLSLLLGALVFFMFFFVCVAGQQVLWPHLPGAVFFQIHGSCLR